MNKPLCVLVDDESLSLKALKDAIEEIGLLEIEASFLDADKFLLKIDQLQSEIIFLDMEMPIYGDKVARRLVNKKVIFVSGYVEHAIKGFEVSAIDFVPKPIRLIRLKEAIVKALENTQKLRTEILVIKSQESKKEEIKKDLILYIESDSDEPRDKQVHLVNGSVIRAKNINFEKILDQLSKSFIRVNPRQIINLEFAYKLIDSDTIGMKSESKPIEINLGESYKKSFFSAKPHFK